MGNKYSAAKIAEMFEENPDLFKAARRPRNKDEVSTDWQPEVKIRITGVTSKDAKIVFTPEQLKVWGAKWFEMRYHPTNIDLIILRKLENKKSGRQNGIFTITQIEPHRIGTATLTWVGLKHQPKLKVNAADNNMFKIPCDISGDFVTLDLSSFETW